MSHEMKTVAAEIDCCSITIADEESRLSSSSSDSICSGSLKNIRSDLTFSASKPYVVYLNDEDFADHSSSSLDDGSCSPSDRNNNDIDEKATNNGQRFRRRRRLSNSSSSPLNVKFEESRNVYHANVNGTDVDLREFWYSSEELTELRLVASNMAGTITGMSLSPTNTMEYEFVELLTKSYLSCCSSFGLAYLGMDDNASVDDFVNDDEDDKNSTEDWSKLYSVYRKEGGEALVGLERVIVREISKDIQDRRKELIYAVQDIQESDPQWASNDADDEDLVMELRQSCELFSQPSRLFAQRLAKLHMPTTTCQPQTHRVKKNFSYCL